ncbi:Ger(x)C family spore germination protein [Alicyclobacillus sp.]|uniref:Ger(x)C family spore germination protein n=1 Tax=Alicyclobacillus sp. TaxID=61169 RepID=UPI0025C6EA88|nr:Ger(x)C family spore germination protein [Alicyclobacillus sp.]MCL6515360.1 Ger(x)C family spore germination protein [Alicyclobacillus sp.]
MEKRKAPARWRTLAAASLAVCGLTSGCYDRQELEQQAFVTTLGIDKAPDGLIDCTFRIALPENPASGGGKGGDTPLAGTGPVTFRAHNIVEALTIANSSVERTISLTHLGQVIFGEDLAREGLSDELQAMTRFREFRPSLYLGVARGKAHDIIAADKPVLEHSPTRMPDSIADVGERTGLFPVVSLHDFITVSSEHHMASMMPTLSVNDSVKPNTQGQQGGQGQGGGGGGANSGAGSDAGDKPLSFTSGQVARSGGNPVEWMGAALFKEGRLVGTIDGRQSMLLSVLQGHIKRTQMTVPDPLTKGQYLSLALKTERTPVYTVRLGEPMQIGVLVPIEADVVSMKGSANYSLPQTRLKVEQTLNRELSEQFTSVLSLLLNRYQCDVVPVALHARHLFPTHEAYVNYPWEDRLKDAQVHVSVQLHVRRFGVQLAPAGDQDQNQSQSQSTGRV